MSNSTNASSPVAAAQRADLIAIIERELAERRNSVFAHYAKWNNDPVGFIENGLLGFAWSKQREICESVLKNRRTAVRSCHDVGKDWVSARIAAWWIATHPPGEAFVVTLAPTAHQVRAILWREIAKAHTAGGLPGRLNQTEWWFGREMVAFGRSPADTDPTAAQGIHARYVLVILDEACGIGKALWDAVDTLITNEECRILAIGNPDDPTTEFATVCRPGSGWNVVGISAFESPNFTDEKVPESLRPLLISKVWVEEKRASWGEDSMLWSSKVLGEFPEQSSDSLIPMSAIRAAHERFEKAEGGLPNEIGVDVARFGDDSTIFYRRHGYKAWVEHRHRKRDLMEIVGQIVVCCRKDKPSRIKIDDTGMGGGVTDRLREIAAYQGKDPDQVAARDALKDVEIIPINVGEAPLSQTADERFANKRAEINWGMRVLFTEKAAKIAIAPNDALDNQATQIKYKLTSSGEIQIEKKEDMKKRTKGVSPDDWDALALAFAEPSFPGAGLMEYYARTIAEQQEAQKQQAQGGGFGKPAPTEEGGGIRLVVPEGVSTVYGMSGAVYQVKDGEIVADPDDAAPLLGQGFRKPDAA